MKILTKLLTGALLLLSTLVAYGQESEKDVYMLDGKDWKFEGTLPDMGVKNLFHKYLPDSDLAHVPGDVFTDLWRVGRIEDMNYGTNSVKAKWVNEYEWWYFKQFDPPYEMKDKRLRIQFDGVDYACDVYFNGEYLGTHEGMFSDFSFDVTDLMIYTSPDVNKNNRGFYNFLAIRIHPAIRNISLANGKKYRWHGDDYNQNVVPTGVSRSVKLIATGDSRITDLYINPTVTKIGEKSSAASVAVELEMNNDSDQTLDVEAQINLTGENFKSKNYTAVVKQSLKPGLNMIKTTIDVPDAQLWYPWDLGDQNLYQAKAVVKSAGEVQDVESLSFGIRKVEMKMNPGWSEDEVRNPWTVMINGDRHFIRSGTWGGPPDRFTGRTNEQTYRTLIRLAKEANINNLRIFAWHPTEIPLFYKLCNEAGITVWQDMAVMNNTIIQSEDLKQAAIQETITALKQRRNEPCNIIIEGSEEILYIWPPEQRKYQWDVVNEIGDSLRKYTTLHYLPTSPLSDANGISVGNATNESAHPHDAHYSVGVEFMEDYYSRQNFAVIPELAITSCPDVESIRKFIPEDELWPPKLSWGFHWADLDILQAHNYEVFGEDFTDRSLENFVEATQVAQGTYFQYAFEMYRTRKPKMSAICFCHFILNSPDFKWATVDYYLRPKESHYYIQKSFQPLLVTLQYEKRRWMPGTSFEGQLWAVNDYMRGYEGCSVNMRVLNDKKEVVQRETYSLGNVEKDSAKKFFDVKFEVPGEMHDKFYVELEMFDKAGTLISKNDYMLLVDNQEEALKVFQKYGAGFRERIATYGKGKTRYYPGMYDNSKGLDIEWLDVK